MKFFMSEGGLDKLDIMDICVCVVVYVEAGVGSVTASSGVVSVSFLLIYVV